jgi:hypothetical protein
VAVMINKLFSILGMATPIIIHIVVMSVILALALLNIKYGVEAELMSTNYFYLVDSIYGMVHLLYFGSIISFIVLYLSFCLISKWIENRKQIQANHIENNK